MIVRGTHAGEQKSSRAVAQVIEALTRKAVWTQETPQTGGDVARVERRADGRCEHGQAPTLRGNEERSS